MTTNICKTISINLDVNGTPTKMEFVWNERGSFNMGASENETVQAKTERPQFRVELTKDFWIGKYPVTQSQWTAIMGTNPSFHSSESWDCPVENVSWHDANSFCATLSKYLVDTFPEPIRAQLPFESQWEYACRAGTSTVFYSGDSEEDLNRIAWYAGNSDGKTHPVGMKEPNAWGLHNMLGNVEEWCFDPFSRYPVENQYDWVGTGSPIVRSTRSDCYWSPFGTTDFSNIASRRGYADPKEKGKWRGFRVCITKKGPSTN